MMTTTVSSGSEGTSIDTDLYSRQIGAFGLETMGKLIKMRVLIYGLGGAGVETAKNLILAGPNTVALHDNAICRIQDLASNFYITENDVEYRRTRADACAPRLAELNDYVNTTVIKGELTLESLRDFDVVVMSGAKRSVMVEVNLFCRRQQPPIGFISMDTFGLAAVTFTDFGDEFTLFDATGEQTRSAIIEGITQDNPGTVHLHQEGKPSQFYNNDYVTFKEIKGMTELNNCEPIQIKATGKYSFTIGDTTKFTPYERDGIVESVKMASKIHFKSLQECILKPVPGGAPQMIVPDFGKFGRTEQLHLAIQAVYMYQDIHGHLPPSRDAVAVEECMQYARELNENSKVYVSEDISHWRSVPVDEIDSNVVRDVVYFAICDISPMAAFIGGIVAQEVVKFTGKFGPIRQWFYFDAFECIPKNPPEDTATLNCRYDYHLIIWGAQFQTLLGRLNLFLVGAGALGCEFLKSFACMGCCTKTDQGCLFITDMDRIEVSNLNRQFLFRRHHVGYPKSITAANAAQGMNSDINIKPSETRVGVDTENEYNDAFWERLDVVVNALDNIQSRLYVDGRCVWYHKPLLESGTLGTRANVQVVVPKLTSSYGDSQDPPEDSIPMCTLRHFPNQIEHTIEWARDAFEGLFSDGPREAAAFLDNSEKFLNRLKSEGTTATQRERITKIHGLLTRLLLLPTFEICVEKAVKLFVLYFDHQISQLLHSFPLDHTTTAGLPFWSGPKRPPYPIQFDPEDPTHLSFVVSAANLFACNFGINQQKDDSIIKQMASRVKVEPFIPKQVRIKVDENDDTIEGAFDDEAECGRLAKELVHTAAILKSNNLAKKITPVEFEKDDDSNYHIQFMTACANLRARNYRIAECDRHKTKMIAGKIIPAIATTTAMVTGLVSLELIKVVTYKERVLDDFKNAFIDLAEPAFILFLPIEPPQNKDKDYDTIAAGPVRAQPNGFTSWDILEFNIPHATLQQLIEAIEKTQNVEVSILSVGNACLYNSFLKAHKERLAKQVQTLTETITKTPLPKGRTYVAVEASCSDSDGIDVMLPTIKLNF